jgi:hypothetical protein
MLSLKHWVLASVYFGNKVCHFLDKKDWAVFFNLFLIFCASIPLVLLNFWRNSPNCQVTQNWKNWKKTLSDGF